MKVLLVSSDRSTPDGRAINLGDALLTDALAKALSRRGASVTVADFGGTRAGPGVDRVTLSNAWQLAKQIRASDGVVVGGGTLLQNDRPDRIVGGLPRLLFTVSLLAWIVATPVVYFGVGCDPVRERLPRLLLRLALSKRRVWLRDSFSVQRCLEQLGKAGTLAADVSLLLAAEVADVFASHPRGGGGLVVALNAEDAVHLTPSFVHAMRGQFGRVTFLSMSQGGANRDWMALAPAARDAFDRVTESLSWQEAVTICARADVVLASRMHAMYVSMMVGTPVTGLAGQPKVEAFISEFGVRRTESLDAWDGEGKVAESAALQVAADRVESELDSALITLGRRRSDRGVP